MTKNSSSASFSVGVLSMKDVGEQEVMNMVQLSLSAGKDIRLTANNDANLQAATVIVNHNVKIHCIHDIIFLAGYDYCNGREIHKKSFAGVIGFVNVGILGTGQSVKEAIIRFGYGNKIHKIGNGRAEKL